MNNQDRKTGDAVLRQFKRHALCTDEMIEQEFSEMDEKIMQQFKKHARACSFHYADDSGNEWGLARQEKGMALELFDTHPHLHDKMREEMKKELWAGEFLEARPL